MLNRLRIAMIAPFGIRPKGTLSARMLPLAQALRRRGHAVEIVAPALQNPQDAGTRVVHGGVPVTHIAAQRLPGAVGAIEQALGLRQAALAMRPDVIHLFKPKGYGGLAALTLPQRIRFVVDTDDWEGWGGWNDMLPYPRAAKALFAWQERALPRRARAVTVVSRALERQARGFGVPPEHIFYLPNGVPPAGAGPAFVPEGRPADPPTLLLYTRFWELDLRELIAALAGIVAGCPAARLLVVGRGERGEERELLRLATRAGLAPAVDYRGWAEPERIPGLLAEADIALVPMENTLINRARGLAKLLELMAAGLPIVASRVGQAAEYIEDQRSGMLTPPGDPGAMASAALRLLGDAALRARLGAGARLRAAAFSWDALAPAAEGAYGL